MSPRVARHGRWLIAACLCAVVVPAQALRLQAQADGLETSERVATQALFDRALQRLPQAWQDALPGTIVVRWSDALPARVHGRARHDDILLNRALLPDLAATERSVSVADDDPALRRPLAALLHELAHLYDRHAAGGRLSLDPRLLDLAGWQVGGMRWSGRRGDNRFVDRTPDAYELSDPREFVAVNLEHVLLDPDYACRRPALYRYFAARLGMTAAAPPCASDVAFLQAGIEAGDTEPLLRIDPARIYQVDYLLAEANAQPMSRWGHSMLRLVVCAPGRPRGPDCRLDLPYHQVLSFRAYVDDVQLSSWRGLTGSYPSRLFVLPLSQVVEEYTKVELRGLRSVPLRLDDAEIASLLERAAQLHWSYDGRYYFFSNNCAVETYKLLHDGVPRLARLPLRSVTPTGLLRRLQRLGIADASVLEDPVAALRAGYRFDSLRERFQAMYDAARQSLPLPSRTVERWMALAPGERRPWLQRGDLRASAGLLLLEQAALRRARLEARDALKQRYLSPRAGDRDTAVTEAADTLREIFAQGGVLGHPATLLAGQGYGLPQAGERRQLANEGTRRQASLLQLDAALATQLRDLLPPGQAQTLEALQANVDLIGLRLRTLDRAAGGMVLP